MTLLQDMLSRKSHLCNVLIFLICLYAWIPLPKMVFYDSASPSTALPQVSTLVASWIEKTKSDEPDYTGDSEVNATQKVDSEVNATQKVEQFNETDFDFEALTSRMRNAATVIYNRVTKTGSSTTSAALKRTALHWHLNYSVSKDYSNWRPSHVETSLLVKHLSSQNQPWIYQRHLHFVNFTKYGQPSPLYINMVRRPVDRFFSYYHYVRFQIPNPIRGYRRDMTFNSCVLSNHMECQQRFSFQQGSVPYFCGQSDVCMTPCQAAVDKAIDNVNKHYGAIGLIEDFVHSIALFEQTMPQIFSDMTLIVSDLLVEDKRKNVAKRTFRKDPEVMKTMSERMFFENQFYEFIKKRFHAFLIHFKTDDFLKARLPQMRLEAIEIEKRKQGGARRRQRLYSTITKREKADSKRFRRKSNR